MALKKVATQKVLHALQDDPEFVYCYLTNKNKKRYTLDVLKINIEELTLELEVPDRREEAVCAQTAWELAFRDRRGIYRAEVLEITEKEESLALTIGAELIFLARRKNIRFAMGSRNPVAVSIQHRGETCTGHLMDLSMEGMCIVIDQEHGFKKGETIEAVTFELRGISLCLSSLHITHVVLDGEEHPNMGVCFQELPVREAELVKHAFNEWYMSQRVTLAT